MPRRDSRRRAPECPVRLGSHEDDAARIRFFEGIAAVIDAAAYEQPLCIVIDDAQHASPASLDLLAYLSGRLRASPVLIVIAFRAERSASSVAERLRGLV